MAPFLRQHQEVCPPSEDTWRDAADVIRAIRENPGNQSGCRNNYRGALRDRVWIPGQAGNDMLSAHMWSPSCLAQSLVTIEMGELITGREDDGVRIPLAVMKSPGRMPE
jgi:hypothetical protein